MVVQYPMWAKVIVPGESVKDGPNYTEGTPVTIFESRCRPEPARNNSYIVGVDGKQVLFSSIVYLPVPRKIIIPSEDVEPGQTIYGGETISYTVEETGGDTATVPGVNGRNFYLRMDGRILNSDEYDILPSGFKLKGTAGTLISGQRFELSTYYTFTTLLNNNSIGIGSSFEIKPGSLFEVWEGERLVVRTTVKQFSKGQLNMRVWV